MQHVKWSFLFLFSLVAVAAPDQNKCTDYTCLYDARVDRTPSFKQQCEDWCKGKGFPNYDAAKGLYYDANWNNCMMFDRDVYLKDPSVRPKYCKNPEFNHDGHGLTNDQVDKELTACATQYPGGTCRFTSSGCSEGTPANQQRISDLLNELAKAHKVCGKVTFNQTDANPRVCVTPVTFTFSPDAKCTTEFAECNSAVAERTGVSSRAFCFTPGQTSSCWDKKNKETTETCCLTGEGQRFMRLGDAKTCPVPRCDAGVIGTECWLTNIAAAATCDDNGTVKPLCCGDKFGMPPEFAKGGKWMLGNCVSASGPNLKVTATPSTIMDGGSSTISVALETTNPIWKLSEISLTGLIDGKEQTYVLDVRTPSLKVTLETKNGAKLYNTYSAKVKACATASDGTVKCVDLAGSAAVTLKKEVAKPTCTVKVAPDPVTIVQRFDQYAPFPNIETAQFPVKGEAFATATVKLPDGHEVRGNPSMSSERDLLFAFVVFGPAADKAMTKFPLVEISSDPVRKGKKLKVTYSLETCLKGTDFCAWGECSTEFTAKIELAPKKEAPKPAPSPAVSPAPSPKPVPSPTPSTTPSSSLVPMGTLQNATRTTISIPIETDAPMAR